MMGKSNKLSSRIHFGQKCNNCGQFHSHQGQIKKKLQNIEVYKFRDFYNKQFQKYAKQKRIDQAKTSKKWGAQSKQKQKRNSKNSSSLIGLNQSKMAQLRAKRKNEKQDGILQDHIQLHELEGSLLQKSSIWQKLYKDCTDSELLGSNISQQRNNEKNNKKREVEQYQNSFFKASEHKQQFYTQATMQQTLKYEKTESKKINQLFLQKNKQTYKKYIVKNGKEQYNNSFHHKLETDESIQNEETKLNEINIFNYQLQAQKSNQMEFSRSKMEKKQRKSLQLKKNYNLRSDVRNLNGRTKTQSLAKQQYITNNLREQLGLKLISSIQHDKNAKKSSFIKVVSSKNYKNSFWDNRCCGQKMLNNQNEIDNGTQAFVFQVKLQNWK